jgi:hypothetical protein
MNATRDEYIAEVKRLFNAAKYGWSVWEEESANDDYDNDVAAHVSADRMSDQWVRRKADRNV